MKRKWWQDKVAYEIYPKSFADSNGDGIGDLPGIIAKLDYLKELGVDIIWIGPCYRSPFADQGYDISDYYSIDPVFGTMEDMERLLEETKKRDMYVLMDLVVNHCSDEHPWFKKAMEDPDGEYGKYFYIEECPDGHLPCNWRSYFGGPVWEQIPGTNKYYFHSFHKKQPDLNWENENLRQEIYKMMNWWLDKGLAGFRIDAIINIKKVLPFKDYESDREDGLCYIGKMLDEADGIQDFLKEMYENTFQPHNAFTVGEVMNAKKEEYPNYIGENGYFSSMFDFSASYCDYTREGWYTRKGVTPEMYKGCCFHSQKEFNSIGFIANIIENHDSPRGASRYIPSDYCNDTSKKMLATISLMLKGIPFLFQGQELGMENVQFKDISQVNDVSTLDEYQIALNAGLNPDEALKAVGPFSRDHGRTPMQWDDTANAGFTTGTPWLLVNDNYKEINALKQVGNPDSVFEYYKQLIKLRKNPEYKETIVYGDFEPAFENQENVIAFYRKSKDQTILVLANANKQEKEVVLPAKVKKILLNNRNDVKRQDQSIMLKEFQALIVELENENAE